MPRTAYAALLLAATTALALPAAPASAHGDRERIAELSAQVPDRRDALVQSPNVAQVAWKPGQVGISGCFLRTAPIFVTSGLDSVRVWDVSDPAAPEEVGVLPSAQFENEAMNCGERHTAAGTERFVLIGVDTHQASTDDIAHTNVGGGELVVVDVTDPTDPHVRSRVPATTSTHTVACVRVTSCDYAYSAGGRSTFSILDLRDLDHPVEVDADRTKAGVQPHASPTGGHKWNVDAAGIATHTGYAGASMWSTRDPARPRLLATTGAAGAGTDPRHPGWNDFIEHNSARPHATRFKAGAAPSLRNGNVLLTTEEDYEQTDCAKAGSFQTWWVKRLDGKPGGIVPLDKVELADLGSYPLPVGAFCSSHWFDVHPSGLVAAGFYGGGMQVLDVRNPRDIKAYGHAVQLGSEVWDAMWVPTYDARGRQTGGRTNVVYAIDLVRGLDVYAVDVPGDGRGAVPPGGATTAATTGGPGMAAALPVALVGGAAGVAVALRRRAAGPRRARTQAPVTA